MGHTFGTRVAATKVQAKLLSQKRYGEYGTPSCHLASAASILTSNQQEVHVGVFTELSCHEKAQRGLDYLQQDPDSAPKIQSNIRLHKPWNSTSGAPIETSPKRRRREEASTKRSPKRCRRQDPEERGLVSTNPRHDNPRHDNPQHDNPQHDNPQHDKDQQGKEQDVQAIVAKATNGLNKLRVENKEAGVSRDIGLFTELPVQLADGRMEVKAHQSRHRTQDSNTMWRFANDHDGKAKAMVWLFRLLSVCLSMIETSLHKKPASLGNQEDLRKSGWVRGMSILNRIIDQVGFVGLRLYDAYAKAYRQSIADLAAKVILKQGMSAPANSRVLYLPHVVWLLCTSNYEERLSQAHVCKLLGLESFAKFQINSSFVSLEELYQEQIRLQCPRPNISTARLFHEDEWRISVVEDSATAALAAGGVAITPGSSSSLEVARSQDHDTPIEASGRSQEPQIQRSAVEPSSEVHTTSEELGPSFAEQLSTQGLLTDQPRCQSAPLPTTPSQATRTPRLVMASASPLMAAVDNQAGSAVIRKPTASNISGHETGIPANVSLPREQNLPRYRSYSNPPSRHPAKMPHQAHQAPYRACTSGSQEEVPMQEPSTSLQLDHQSETDATHGLILPSPELGEEADMTTKDIDPGSSPDSSTQDLPPFDVLGHEPTRDGAHRQQSRDPTPLPMPSNDNSAPDKQSQSSPRTTPPIRMAVKTTRLPTDVPAYPSPPSEIPYENAESQDRDDTSGRMYSQGPQNRHSIVESSEEESTAGVNVSPCATRTLAMTPDQPPQPHPSQSDVSIYMAHGVSGVRQPRIDTSANSSPRSGPWSENEDSQNHGTHCNASRSGRYHRVRQASLPHAQSLPLSMDRCLSAPPSLVHLAPSQWCQNRQVAPPSHNGTSPRNDPREPLGHCAGTGHGGYELSPEDQVGSRAQTLSPCFPRQRWAQPPATESNHKVDMGQNSANSMPSPTMPPQSQQHSVPEMEIGTGRPEPLVGARDPAIPGYGMPNFLQEDIVSRSHTACQEVDQHVPHNINSMDPTTFEHLFDMAFNCVPQIPQNMNFMDSTAFEFMYDMCFNCEGKTQQQNNTNVG
ncbi:hypothetical protein CEP54_013144 [Fusarium duplospermum]|uniref:Uncharacterized protein n=1 Tax=Fusarium duplospermum TaxID=1325734 RepID=A0A428P4K4_9HYPO|nr:hypothetical protein CEP54_013144 [Fusarium duplospermum]